MSSPQSPPPPVDATENPIDQSALPAQPLTQPHSAGLRQDMEVLRELASDECLDRGGLGVVRIAERLGREKSQVSRALRALEAEGLVERDPQTHSYLLGWGLYTVASRGIEARLIRAASAHLHGLADAQQAEVRLCVLIGRRVLTLMSVPAKPAKAVRAEAPYETPCGPVLALDWSRDALRHLVPAGTPGHDDLLAGLHQARQRGYVHYPQTKDAPARYAAAVRDFRGTVIAAIQLAQRPEEMTRDGSDGSAPTGIPAGQAVRSAADGLSADLGFEQTARS
ncbi:MAG: hypothetical protein QOF35_1509 [Actinomycetota bacterium]|nr:hypothetical protein [Actinomycetota bacterium]